MSRKPKRERINIGTKIMINARVQNRNQTIFVKVLKCEVCRKRRPVNIFNICRECMYRQAHEGKRQYIELYW